MTIDNAIRKSREDNARAFHDALVRAGVRPQGSRMEDYLPKRDQVSEPEAKAVGQRSEAAE